MNVALVRATNVIPYFGIVKSLSNSTHLVKNVDNLYAKAIKDLLFSLDLLPKVDYSIVDEDYLKNVAIKIREVVKDYLPYTMNYNRMVLFSLNGLIPDDETVGFGNNVFSNKCCAVIDLLNEHMRKVISLTPTDTAILGDVCVSDRGIILIEESVYNNLSSEDKFTLLNNKVITFTGDLKTAVDNTLISLGIKPETLSLSRKDEGYVRSSTSGPLIEYINQLAYDEGKATTLYLNILNHQNDDEDLLEEVSDELENSMEIDKYFIKQFISYLGKEIDIDLESDYSNTDSFYKYIESIINSIGINRYKEIVDSYNRELEEKRDNDDLLTPNEIINRLHKSRR